MAFSESCISFHEIVPACVARIACSSSLSPARSPRSAIARSLAHSPFGPSISRKKPNAARWPEELRALRNAVAVVGLQRLAIEVRRALDVVPAQRPHRREAPIELRLIALVGASEGAVLVQLDDVVEALLRAERALEQEVRLLVLRLVGCTTFCSASMYAGSAGTSRR